VKEKGREEEREKKKIEGASGQGGCVFVQKKKNSCLVDFLGY
jgi:hypothetical protein